MNPKSLYVVILSCGLVHFTIIGLDAVIYHTVRRDGDVIYQVSQGVAYLLYPLLGWLADVYFTRYKFVIASFIILILSTLPMVTSTLLYLLSGSLHQYLYLGGSAIVIGLFGLGLFESTAIQLGMDQMMEAPSEQFSTFIHWYYFSSYLGKPVLAYLFKAILFYYDQCNYRIELERHGILKKHLQAFFAFVCLVSVVGFALIQLMSSVVGLCLLAWCKKRLIIDKTGSHPLKLMYKVLKYSWKHKCPERRSAFTYWEEDIPSRIDLGKNKYGGPFTNEEVEDTKTFLRIVLLLLSLIGFHLSGQGYSLLDQLFRHQCPSYAIYFTTDPNTVTILTIIIGIPVYRFVFVRYCSKYLPNMLNRMGLGLLCCFIKELITIVIHATMTGSQACNHNIYNVPMDNCFQIVSNINVNGTCYTFANFTQNEYYCESNNTPFYLTIVPSILQGLSFLLVFMTALEFICAQAPLRLKGLLIGLWYATLAVNCLLVRIPEIFISDPIIWEVFHEVKAFLIFVSLILYLCVSKWYCYRQRDEVVNERLLVEEIYERQLAQAEEYEREYCSKGHQANTIQEQLPILHTHQK